MKELLRSGELARLSGISADTLRHYERIGVLARPRRTQSNYRLYPAEAVERVRLIRRALAMGFSLDELKKILRVREQGGFPCRQVRALMEEKLGRLTREITELTDLRKELERLLEDWDQRLNQTPDGHPARLLEHLPARKGDSNEDTRNRFSRRRDAGRGAR